VTRPEYKPPTKSPQHNHGWHYGVKVIDRWDQCRVCGRMVSFQTDYNGGLVAENQDGTFHPCPDA
jgi:hypothetical protein